MKTASKSGQRKNYSVPAVERAFDILELLVSSGTSRNVTEISRQLKIPKSSVFGILHTLRQRGYIEKMDDERYNLSLKLFGLGASIIASLDIRQQAGPVLRSLAAETNITAHLGVLATDEAVYIDKAEAPGAIRLTTYVGCRAPLHSTGMGKALLAWTSDGEVDRIIASRGLTAFTPRTISSPAALKAELAQVRANGYAVAIEENEPGVCGIGAPVFDHTGHVAAAVNLGGTVLQIKRKDIQFLGACVVRAAAEMSRRLGFTGIRL
ncbi:MAG TPA: IclR family transcriptional regulator [Bryobacteraceae bacterium]|nr:IclR family transcriptional regulator [Bryobacteraceae bacterium]